MAWEAMRHILEQYITHKGVPLILASSGGVDSQVAMHLLAQLGYHAVTCVYCDHGLRDDTAKDWQVVSNLASTLGFEARRHDIASHLTKNNIEESARKARYTVLQKEQQRTGAAWVLTAHHKDDLIESQLLHLARGAGLFGLVGIEEADRSRSLLRPLLSYSKEELVAYAREQGLSWHEDHTNQEKHFMRNVLRHDVLPALRAQYPALEEGLLLLSSSARDTRDFLTRHLYAVLGDVLKNQSFSYPAFLLLDPVLQKHCLTLLERRWGSTYTSAHIESMQRALCGSFPSGSRVHLTGGMPLHRCFDTLYVGQVSWNYTPPPMVTVPQTYQSLGRLRLTPGYRVRQYRCLDGQVQEWHTTVKKWRLQHRIPPWELDQAEGLATQDGDVIAILHPSWTFPTFLPTTLIPLPT